jgi:hypothetical protein
MIDRFLEWYFEGRWLGYALAFVAGMAAWRFLSIPGDSDVLGFSVLFAMVAAAMGLKRLTDR